jgi:hypothetical protein
MGKMTEQEDKFNNFPILFVGHTVKKASRTIVCDVTYLTNIKAGQAKKILKRKQNPVLKVNDREKKNQRYFFT